MTTNTESIIFFGTGQISLAALKTASDLFRIEAVFTKPDSEHHGKLIVSPVKEWASAQGLKILQPSSGNELTEQLKSNNFTSNMGLLVDYGIIVKQSAIDFFKLGIVNSHFSLLPKLRGADPITGAILEGLEESGITLMQLVEKLDAGPIIAQEKLTGIGKMNVDELDKAFVDLNNEMLRRYLIPYCQGNIKTTAQVENEATYTKKLDKNDGLIDENKSAIQVEREVRAYLSWPGSFFEWQGERIIIKQASLADYDLAPLQLTVIDGKLVLGCKSGSIEIQSLQIAGKKEMTAKDFMNGHRSKLK
jgi:methionyl-tRNA formyltransferase